MICQSMPGAGVQGEGMHVSEAVSTPGSPRHRTRHPAPADNSLRSVQAIACDRHCFILSSWTPQDPPQPSTNPGPAGLCSSQRQLLTSDDLNSPAWTRTSLTPDHGPSLLRLHRPEPYHRTAAPALYDSFSTTVRPMQRSWIPMDDSNSPSQYPGAATPRAT